MAQKIKRSFNFVRKEEDLLLSLVHKFKDIVECKRTDKHTNKVKNEAWEAITKDFNNIYGEHFRDNKCLRNKYENLKRRRNKYAGDIFGRETTGEVERDFSVSTDEEEIKDIIYPQYTQYDDDDDNDNDVVNDHHESGAEDMVDVKIEPEEIPAQSVYATSSSVPKTVISTPLIMGDTRNHNKDVLINKLTKWGSKKIELADLQKECFLEEHRLKLLHMREKHENYLKLQNIEHREKVKQLEEQHKLQMEILNLQKQRLLDK